MRKNTALLKSAGEYNYNPITDPLFMTSTYVQPSVDEHGSFLYTGLDNPNFVALEKIICQTEGGAIGSLVFPSGMSAINAVSNLLCTGDHILCADCVYDGTATMFATCYKRFGITCDFVDMNDLSTLEKSIQKNTRLIRLEMPSNPLLKVYDLEKICLLAKERNILVGVDSTFMTPLNFSPLLWGADIVAHSTTKYMGGHADTMGGALSVKDDKLLKDLFFTRKALGLIPSPFNCWLIQRGMKTLSVRLERQEKNALQLAQWLEKQDFVEKVVYPGLESYQSYSLAQKYFVGGGAMIAVILDREVDVVKKAIGKLQYWKLAVSLGGVESLVDYTYFVGGSSLPTQMKNNVGESFVRLSVGIEDIDDLIEDLAQAFAT